ncbi:MAG: GNAT family N-acetyltransferase [Christensenellales bacterium]
MAGFEGRTGTRRDHHQTGLDAGDGAPGRLRPRTFFRRLGVGGDGCFTNKPVRCYYAARGEEIIGFSCCDSTARGFFGPTGVLPAYRGKGIGKALLLAALHHLKDLGYAYAIIGGAGPTGFYEQACGAVEIPGSVPGIYKDLHV